MNIDWSDVTDIRDLIVNLRAQNYDLTDRAADEIERLREEVARLKAVQAPAQVGGDEREAFRDALTAYALACYANTSAHEMNVARDRVRAIYDRAALSADGGEDKRDAERYRIVRLIPTLVMHYGLLEGGSGLDARCDATIAANQARKGDA